MPKSPLTDKMANRAPKFGDEGEPEESARGTAAGPDDGADAGGGPPSAGPPMPGAPTPGGMDPTEAKAIDDMGDVLGIGPEDRADFGMALKAYVSSCIESTLADSGPPGGGMPMPMPMGEPDGDEEEPQ